VSRGSGAKISEVLRLVCQDVCHGKPRPMIRSDGSVTAGHSEEYIDNLRATRSEYIPAILVLTSSLRAFNQSRLPQVVTGHDIWFVASSLPIPARVGHPKSQAFPILG